MRFRTYGPSAGHPECHTEQHADQWFGNGERAEHERGGRGLSGHRNRHPKRNHGQPDRLRRLHTLSQNATISGPESLVFTPTIAPPQVVALIEPAGGVVTPPSSSALGPLTILAGSQGFNTSGVYDYLASTKDSNGNPLQALGLSFYGQGLASLANGGILKFSLNVARSERAAAACLADSGGLDHPPAIGQLDRFRWHKHGNEWRAATSQARHPSRFRSWSGRPWLGPGCCESRFCESHAKPIANESHDLFRAALSELG